MSIRVRAAGWARAIEQVSAWAAGTCLAVNIAVVLFGIVMRYGLAASPIWVDELARYALIWAVLLAGAAAMRRGEHMQIEILLEALPPGPVRIVDAFRRLVILAVLVFMAAMGTYYAQKVSVMSTLALSIPRSVPTAAIPAGMGLMLAQFVLLQIAGPEARRAAASGRAI